MTPCTEYTIQPKPLFSNMQKKAPQPITEYDKVDVAGIPRNKADLAGYYGYANYYHFQKSHMAIVYEEWKRLGIEYNKDLQIFTLKQLKVIIGCLGRM